MNADFFKCIELDCELPGAPLVVEVMDCDDWSADDLIGRTVIDLEDRWFDASWQGLGEETLVAEPAVGEKLRWRAKPKELRPLRTPAQMQPQGYLECWVDILEPGEAITFPPDDITLPLPKSFQVGFAHFRAATALPQPKPNSPAPWWLLFSLLSDVAAVSCFLVTQISATGACHCARCRRYRHRSE